MEKVQHGSIHASSSGDFNGRNLEVKEGEFHASSSASISAMVSQKASAQASSSGDVNLKNWEILLFLLLKAVVEA